MSRRRCGLEGDPSYEIGMDGERRVQRKLQRMGYMTERSVCSLGAADIRATNPNTGELYLVQVKATEREGHTPRISEREEQRLRLAALREGATPVVALVRPGRRHELKVL